MLFDIVTFTDTELNAGETTKQIEDKEISRTTGSRYYRPDKIRVNNATGATLYVRLFTAEEYTAFIADPTISEQWEVTNTEIVTFTDIMGEVSYILASGTTGHTADLNVYVTQEY